MYDNYYTKKPRVKLYVRRVFISESFEELLPKWLSWLVGLVDSDTMPLNVSREMLQLHEGLKVIKKKLVRKALDMIKKLSDAEVNLMALEEAEAKGEDPAVTDAAEQAALRKEGTKYSLVWKAFGKAIKMGVIEDTTNRKRIMPLLRFYSSASKANFTTLDGYVSRMKENQKHIYFLVGNSIEDLERSPFVEALVEKDLEVIYFTDPLDEYMMGHINEHEGKEFSNVSKDELKVTGDEADEDAEKKREKRLTEAYKGVSKWWKELVAGYAVSGVKVSRRLSSTPCVVTSSKWGWSATMERVARSQALSDPEKYKSMRGMRTLEINPKHPIIKEIRARFEANPDDPALKDQATLLFETCYLDSGYALDDVKPFNSRVLSLLKTELGVEDLTDIKDDDELLAEMERKEEEEAKRKAAEAERKKEEAAAKKAAEEAAEEAAAAVAEEDDDEEEAKPEEAKPHTFNKKEESAGAGLKPKITIPGANGEEVELDMTQEQLENLVKKMDAAQKGREEDEQRKKARQAARDEQQEEEEVREEL
jgi:heat shock protein 90kDa beta